MSIASEMAEAICSRRRFVLKDMHGYTMFTIHPADKGWTITRDALNSHIPAITVCESLRVSEGDAGSAVLHIGMGAGAFTEQALQSSWRVEVGA